VDVDGLPDAFEDPIQDAKSRVVLPAVDVLGVDVEDVLTEAFGREPRDTRFPGSRRPEEEGCLPRFVVHDWLQGVREDVYFLVAMLYLLWGELGLEDTSISDHLGKVVSRQS
jgi:hypothetical protein